MMLPKIGQTIRLDLADDWEENRDQTLKSRVADLRDDIAVIELPISEKTGRMAPLQAGTQCNVWYIGEDGSRYEFRTSVIGRQNENIPVLYMSLPQKEAVKRNQRRDYLRIHTSVEIAVRLEDSIRQYHFLARTIDLSGGGLSFTCEESYRLMEKDKLMIWLSLPNKAGQIMHAYGEGEVVRVKPPGEKGKHQWVSVKFTHIGETDRAKVVRACYERQLEMRKKGVLE
ncbi:flagellar brake domain-containing protein [Brevibacillus ruminantium]|uniref:Flagellar brake domain-containing protein n=1 Tax=Brevibacillus ruminantium TaxID=2950604 RepID=A0ABY4W8N9_9BACL|nr:flagellar brake domain-containing protein [Brevibacillus ruminantium]USG63538.1 flagellar brake domain-containing protein [Brevibacillus ruminantium]